MLRQFPSDTVLKISFVKRCGMETKKYLAICLSYIPTFSVRVHILQLERLHAFYATKIWWTFTIIISTIKHQVTARIAGHISFCGKMNDKDCSWYIYRYKDRGFKSQRVNIFCLGERPEDKVKTMIYLIREVYLFIALGWIILYIFGSL